MSIAENAKSHEIIRHLANIPGRHGTTGMCKLHHTKAGRLVVTGQQIDLLDLLLWVEQNPLTQFRVIKASDGVEPWEPGDLFKHLFDSEGNVI